MRQCARCSGYHNPADACSPWVRGTRLGNLDIRTLECAKAYASKNGFDPNDRLAVGLVLVGMAIAAGCSDLVRDEIWREYLRTFPDAEPPIRAWIHHIETGR